MFETDEHVDVFAEGGDEVTGVDDDKKLDGEELEDDLEADAVDEEEGI